MRLRVMDLPTLAEGALWRFALIVDQVGEQELCPELVAQMQRFANEIDAAGVLVTGHSVELESTQLDIQDL